MAKRDLYHEQVKQALIKDGWTITHDPFALEIGDRRLEADLAAERLIGAEKGVRRIVVEIKSFLGRSTVNDLEQALGQYMLYQRIMEYQRIDRELYLAVPTRTFETIFTVPLGRILLSPQLVCLLVFDDRREEIVSWIPA
jgi:hypothetical protein